MRKWLPKKPRMNFVARWWPIVTRTWPEYAFLGNLLTTWKCAEEDVERRSIEGVPATDYVAKPSVTTYLPDPFSRHRHWCARSLDAEVAPKLATNELRGQFWAFLGVFGSVFGFFRRFWVTSWPFWGVDRISVLRACICAILACSYPSVHVPTRCRLTTFREAPGPSLIRRGHPGYDSVSISAAIRSPPLGPQTANSQPPSPRLFAPLYVLELLPTLSLPHRS